MGAVERDAKSAGVGVAKDKELRFLTTRKIVVSMGDEVDIIFDLTGTRTRGRT